MVHAMVSFSRAAGGEPLTWPARLLGHACTLGSGRRPCRSVVPLCRGRARKRERVDEACRHSRVRLLTQSVQRVKSKALQVVKSAVSRVARRGLIGRPSYVFRGVARALSVVVASAMAPTQDKRILYVGGLSDEVTEETLHAAFIPFGEVTEVNIPKNFEGKNNENRGFAFVQFELEPDADEARFNMNGAELFGRVLRVNVARAAAHKLGASKAVWSADEWFKNLNEEGTPASH